MAVGFVAQISIPLANRKLSCRLISWPCDGRQKEFFGNCIVIWFTWDGVCVCTTLNYYYPKSDAKFVRKTYPENSTPNFTLLLIAHFIEAMRQSKKLLMQLVSQYYCVCCERRPPNRIHFRFVSIDVHCNVTLNYHDFLSSRIAVITLN